MFPIIPRDAHQVFPETTVSLPRGTGLSRNQLSRLVAVQESNTNSIELFQATLQNFLTQMEEQKNQLRTENKNLQLEIDTINEKIDRLHRKANKSMGSRKGLRLIYSLEQSITKLEFFNAQLAEKIKCLSFYETAKKVLDLQMKTLRTDIAWGYHARFLIDDLFCIIENSTLSPAQKKQSLLMLINKDYTTGHKLCGIM